jgi:N6-adenosine-specific RNA methylase IME4
VTRHRAVRCLVADPPWLFGDGLPGASRGASKNYGCLTVNQLCSAKAFELPLIADDAVLFLWRVSAMVEEAYSVARAWGFTPKSEIVWLKRTKTGKRWFGMGRSVRAEHETCIIATRGRPTILSRSIRSTFAAAVPEHRHSAKPEEFFDLVEQLVPGPYYELFARRQRPGWTCSGNELPTTHQETTTP